MSDDLLFLSIDDTRATINRGEVTPAALLAAHLDAIARHNPTLNAFLTVTPERAEADLAAARPDAPLGAIPFAVKDNIDTAGIRTTAASRLLADNVPARDAAVVTALGAAGGVLLGKLNTYEFGTGSGAVYDDLAVPVARNPFDPSRFSGGSTTGGGVAVAAGLAKFAIGTDTGGSVRLPAAACGIVGLKPTLGRIATAGMQPNCPSLDHVGPLARSVADTRRVFAALCRDGGTGGGAERLRVGVLRRFHERDVPCEDDIARGFEDCVAALTDAGLTPIEIDLTHGVLDFRACSRVLNVGECYSIHRRTFEEDRERIGAALRDKLIAGSMISADAYIRALRWRRALAAEVDALFHDCEIVLSMGTPMVAPPLSDVDRVIAFTGQSAMAVYNVSGHPALVLSPGLDRNGMPLNIQLAAGYGREALLLDVAERLEAVLGTTPRPDPRRYGDGGALKITEPLTHAESVAVQTKANEAAIARMPAYFPSHEAAYPLGTLPIDGTPA
ncbi:amidase [Acuticoccus kandeliae]|uniref:amidase n=1 Tax=Acuticoccus kandeliae TaxID=2073160 RepID=UPI000D3E0D1F|nr:amidase [Acuticoccus kandeliae]